MLPTTLPWLRCPTCSKSSTAGDLFLAEVKQKKASDILFGTLACRKCGAQYPILAGVAVLVSNIDAYLQFHVKGVSSLVRDEDLPDAYIDGYLQAKSEIETDLTEEDLESQRINALYFMNHYLSVKDSKANPWWRPKKSPFSPEIDQLVTKFWDHGPFTKIGAWTKALKPAHIVEIGCGVGGLAKVVAQKGTTSYLGIDMSFASIALARHIYLNAPYSAAIQTPEDLLRGPLTGKPKRPKLRTKGPQLDFIVAELERLPVASNSFDLAIALNTIDMIEDPRQLPRLHADLLRQGGVAIQSGPYIWQKNVAARLRKTLPKKIRSSSAAVEYLYEEAGFSIFKKIEHVPWLFLKHYRQIEMYSVHLFAARKNS